MIRRCVKGRCLEAGYAGYAIEHDILKDYVSEILIVRKDASYDEKVIMMKDAEAV